MTKKLFYIIITCLISCLHVSGQSSASKEIIYLSGTDAYNTRTWDFWATGGRNAGKWSKIEVPSHWEQQGFGAYNYGRDYVTYGKNFRFADEQGIYKHRFNVPVKWKNRRLFILFEGVMTDTEVKINGRSAGPIHRGAFYEFTYDITELVNYGRDNSLEVKVSKMSTDKSVNNAERLADYWVFGGIFRPVYLKSVPRDFIEGIGIDAQASGQIRVKLSFPDSISASRVAIDIVNASGKKAGQLKGTIAAGQRVAVISGKLDNPELWTAETPKLYSLNVNLWQKEQLVYEDTERFGFRTIEVRPNDGIYINGTKIKLKGINRHVFWPETGRATNPGMDLKDVQLIKYMNMNAVRCAHYPPDKRFLDLCDSLGLYVIDELAGWQKAYSAEAGAPLVREMVLRDANHPSILFWSNGNEGGHNFALDKAFETYDLSQRKVIHAHHKPGNAFNGIDCNHYEDYYSTRRILDDTTIYMPTEYLHSQDDGGGGAGLSDFWDLHWSSKLGAGGFIWVLADEGIVRTDRKGQIDVNGVNAPDGVVGPHREHEGSVNAIREIFCPVKIKMTALPPLFNGLISVENRFHFTNLNKCSLTWDLINFRSGDSSGDGYSVCKQGKGIFPSVPPTASGKLKLSLPDDWKEYDALALRAFDPDGAELYRWVWKIKTNSQLLQPIFFTEKYPEQINSAKGGSSPAGERDDVPTSFETDSSVTLKAAGIGVTFDKKTGMLKSLANDRSMSLSFGKGPVLVGGSAEFKGLKLLTVHNNVVVECSYEGDLDLIRWTMHPNGWLEMNYSYRLQGEYPFSGISFSYPENFVLGMKWLGKGPYRVWKNRPQGVVYNIWEGVKNNTQAGATPWQFPEFKGYFSDLVWMEMNTVEGKFTVASPDDGMFVRLFDFYSLTGVKPHPELPPGDISFLDCIPPTSTKLGLKISPDASLLGPMSSLNKINGVISRTLYFYFGLPKRDIRDEQFVMPAENILTD